MKNFKFLLPVGLFSLLLLISSSLFAQAPKANFAGTWAFNEAKSKLPEGGFRMASDKLVVTQDAALLTVEQTSQRGTNTMKYTLDGKESSNASGFGTSARVSTLVWSDEGKTLTINSVMSFERDGQKTEFKTAEIWKLTADGLSIESSFNGPQGETKSTAVYDKK